MNKQQAALIIEAHEIAQLFDNEEEMEMLRENNPDLLDAYEAFCNFAGVDFTRPKD